MNDYVEGFGSPAVGEYGYTVGSLMTPPAIKVNSNKVVLFPLMSGLFNQTKFLTLRYLQGLQIELEVVNNYTDVCSTQTNTNPPLGATSSEEWLIKEPPQKSVT